MRFHYARNLKIDEILFFYGIKIGLKGYRAMFIEIGEF